MISIKHAADLMNYLSHFIRAKESRNTEFINATKKLEALLLYADYMFLPRG